MKEIEISIIMPVYNAANYLKESISSILNQTFSNFELIAIDDNSTDESEKIINSFIKKDNRVKYYNNTSKGVSSARNFGIEKACGKYIAFMDADDLMDSRTLEEMYKYINKNNSDICMAGYVEGGLKEEKRIELPFEDGKILMKSQIADDLIPKMIAIKKEDENKKLIMGSVWRLLIKSNLIKDNKIEFNTKVHIAEDLLFCIDVFLNSNSITIMNKCYYYYRRYGNSTLEKYRPNYLEESLYFYDQYENILRKYDMFDVNVERFYISKSSMYTTAISNCFRYDAPKNDKRIRSEILDIIEEYDKDITLKKKGLNNCDLKKKIALKLMKYKCINVLIYFFRIKEKMRMIKI